MSAMFGYEIAPREYHNTSCREGENMYDRCISQLNNSLSSGYFVSGSGYFVFVGDGGDDSEVVELNVTALYNSVGRLCLD